LKPGGTLLVVDGDFVNVSLAERALKKLATTLQNFGLLQGEAAQAPGLADTHKSILSRVYFSNGARADAVAGLFQRVGFDNVIVDTDLRQIHKAQAKNWNYLKALSRGIQHRFAISATKPVSGAKSSE
jgi:hypothetical protein